MNGMLHNWSSDPAVRARNAHPKSETTLYNIETIEDRGRHPASWEDKTNSSANSESIE
jgi:hypothetical protein